MIGLNDFETLWKSIGPLSLATMDRVGRSGRWILGKEVEQFESFLAIFQGGGQAVGCASGTDALQIGLRCLDINAQDKVLTTPLSAFATTLAILQAGATPVFVDTDENGLIDLDQCEELLNRRPDIRYFVPVHLYGHALNLDRLESLKKKFDLKVVEDCAQSFGAAFGSRKTGTVGQMAAASFYPTKNLGCLGDGGAVLTSDAARAARARRLRDYGQSHPYVHEECGLNSRLDELQAALLRDVMFPQMDGWNRRRRAVALRYQSEIRNTGLKMPVEPEGSRSIWHLFPVRVLRGERSSFQKHLSAKGIGTGIHYPRLIPDQPAMKGGSACEITRPLKTAGTLAEQLVSLPIHPTLSEHDVDAVIRACNAWEGR